MMKNTIARRTAAVLAAGALSIAAVAPAAAQQQTKQVNQGNLISALNNISLQIENLNALNDLTVQDVRVVNVEDVANNNNVLNNALNRNEVDIAVLQDFLNNSLNNNNVEVIKNVLNNNDVDVTLDDVVAINVLSGGDVIVFTQ